MSDTKNRSPGRKSVRLSVADWDRNQDRMWSNASCLSGFCPEGLSSVSELGEGESTQTEYEFPHAIARLVTDMRLCLEDLTGTKIGLASSPAAANRAIETAAVLVHESMSATSRTFHTVQHVYDIQNFGANSIQTLSAFFHDIIYYSVDGGLSSLQAEVLRGVIVEEDGGKTVRLHSTVCDGDRYMRLVLNCFGFEPGQVLNPYCGLNEILSAAAAVRCLGELLSETHLLQITSCIEATIPFRKPDPDGKTFSNLLYERLCAVNDEMNLGMTNAEVVKTTQDAVILANSDVMNFSTMDHGDFLAGTWNLLPESNITLRTDGQCYISNFVLALKKMLGFLTHLDPAVIYESFENVPDTQTIASLQAKAKKNLEVSTKYLELKLLAISVIAALAELTGGDAPLCMFIRGMSVAYIDYKGEDSTSEEDEYEEMIARLSNDSLDMPDAGGRTSVIPNFGSVRKSQRSDRCNIVYILLKYGRSSSSTFDLINAPLAAFLYGVIGDTGVSNSLPYCVCPMDSTNAKLLLDSLSPEVVKIIAKSCSRTALTRTEELLEIVKAYS